MWDLWRSRTACCSGFPAARASGRAWQTLEQLWAIGSSGARTAIRPALQHLVTTLRSMSMIYLVSDFITDEDVFGGGEMRALAARHDVIAVIPEDPAELKLPEGHGAIRLRDPESGRAVTVALNSRTRQAYAEAVARRRAALVDGCYRASIDHVFVRTDGPVMEPLLELFARRRIA